jgi:small conductance mechanosensitive channel
MMLENLLPGLDIYIQLARFTAIFIVGMVLTRAVIMPIVHRTASKRGKDKAAVHTYSNLAGIIGGFLSFAIALQAGQFGGLVTVLGTITAALTVAVGFGMRDQIGNLVSGFFIYADRPFLKGDYIGTGELKGRVKEIKLRHTVLESPTSEKVVVPNGKLTGEIMENYTKGNRVNVSVKFEEEVEKATTLGDIGMEVVNSSEKVLEKPEPQRFVRKIEEGKKEVEIGFWVKESLKPAEIKSEILEDVYSEAEKQGVFKKDEDKEEDK